LNEPQALLAAVGLQVGRGAPLLREVTLALYPGEGWFVLGANGSGKTTLLATLLGLVPSLGGSLQWHPELLDRQRLGYVPQEQRFDPPLPCTVAEFVELGLPAGDRGAVARASITSALEAMQVGPLAARAVRTLSLGQRRRVLVARALARRPRLLFLDEPTANLDPLGAAQLAGDLERLRAAGSLCVVHVSHDLSLARRFATHVAFVDAGTVTAGLAAARFADPRLQQAFGGGSP